MTDIETLIALVAVAVILVRVAELIAIPYPIVLVVAGLAIGVLPGGPDVDLAPDVIFLIFLPPLLHQAAISTSPRELRAEIGPLTGLVIGLSLVSMVAVALVAQAVIPWLGWGEALLLGAIVAPTDPVAAVATFSRIGVPDRVAMLVKGESLMNDATALVAYRVALAAVVSGSFGAGAAAIDLVVGVIGGIAIGLAIGWVVLQLQRRLDDPPLAILLSIVTAYASYLVAEHVGASGVLSTVASGLFLGWWAHEAFDADTRLNSVAFWRAFVFALNVVIFILLGLQFPEIVDRVSDELSVGAMIGYGALVSGVVIVVRIGWQFLPPLLEKATAKAAYFDTGDGWRERLVVGWAGMRGAVSLAAALSLPLQFDNGDHFTGRAELIYLTVAVIIVTLVLQGLSLPALIRWLGLNAGRVLGADEAIARLEGAQAVLDRLDEIEEERDDVPEETIERMRELYQARFRRCVAAMAGEETPHRITEAHHVGRELRRELLQVERGVLADQRRAGSVKADVLRTVERDLDLDETRLVRR